MAKAGDPEPRGHNTKSAIRIGTGALAPASSHIKFVLATFLLGTAGLNAVLFWMGRRRVIEGYPDFTIFYAAGLMVRRGQAST